LKAHFITPLVSEDLEGGEAWRLREPLVYFSALLHEYITVPVGFEADSYSAPETPFGSFIIRGIDRRPAFIHDKLYADADLPREVCDSVFLEAMEAAGIAWWRRKLIYRGVRSFGGLFYKDKDENDSPAGSRPNP
jgi:hypothetical protein